MTAGHPQGVPLQTSVSAGAIPGAVVGVGLVPTLSLSIPRAGIALQHHCLSQKSTNRPRAGGHWSADSELPDPQAPNN